MGLEHRISRYFSVEEILPAAGQGIMAVQGSRRMKPFTDCASDPDAVLAAAAERAFVRELDGGCSSPVAAHAERQGQAWLLRGLYYEEETGTYRIGTRTYEMEGTDPALAARMGRELADELRG